jgi:hypothetical protein
MQRDMDLIRKILLVIEEQPAGKRFRVKIEGYDDDAIQGHLALLYEHKLINAIDASSHSGQAYLVRGLTWEGHDFIEAVRNETVWRKAFGIITEKGGGFTLEMIKELLKRLLAEQVLGPAA